MSFDLNARDQYGFKLHAFAPGIDEGEAGVRVIDVIKVSPRALLTSVRLGSITTYTSRISKRGPATVRRRSSLALLAIYL